jgi:hypothetical protein
MGRDGCGTLRRIRLRSSGVKSGGGVHVGLVPGLITTYLLWTSRIETSSQIVTLIRQVVRSDSMACEE